MNYFIFNINLFDYFIELVVNNQMIILGIIHKYIISKQK